MERGSRVRLFVSSGPEQATMPERGGPHARHGRDRLTREGLDVRVERRESDEPENDVIQQSPSPGTKVDKGDRVTIVVSEGQQQVDVPNLVGLSEDDARAPPARGQARHHRAPPHHRQRGGGRPGARPAPGRGRGGRRGPLDHRDRRALRGARGPHAPGGLAGRIAMRVAVLAGGRSSEHDVSLASAAAVRAGLEQGGHEPVAVEISREGRWSADGVPVPLEPAGGLLACDVGVPGAARPLRRGRDGAGRARGARHPLRGRRGDGVGRVHGQGAVQGPDGGQPPAAGRLPGDPRGRASGQARPARAARVREAGPAGLVGGHLEGVHGGGPAGRAEGGVRARPAGDRGGDGRRHGGRVLGAGQPRPGGVGARARS